MLETLKNSLFADLLYFIIYRVKSLTRPKVIIDEIPNIELLQQTKENIKFIEARLRELNPFVNTIKGSSAKETRRKRRNIRERIEWYEGKLKEEKEMTQYYNNKLIKNPQ